MLFFVLIISALHLSWMNLLAFLKVGAINRVLVGVLPIVLLSLVVGSVPLVAQFVALGLLAVVCCKFAPKKPLLHLAGSVPIVALVLGLAVAYAAWLEHSQVGHFPLESMAKRVPEPKAGIRHKNVDKEISELENDLDSRHEEKGPWSRTGMLRRLHENATENFIFSQGFGVTRMAYITPERIERATEKLEPIEQPGIYESHAISTDDLERAVLNFPVGDLRRLHLRGVADFVNPKGFGYVKDREHVAGFIPHQFSKTPSEARLKRLVLVSLLMHSSPVVYVSDELPRMGEGKHAPTRTLNEFELKGLAALEEGEHLFVRETPNALLMLGAIRSVKQCVQCHGGERGDLLGAFSYCLTVGQ